MNGMELKKHILDWKNRDKLKMQRETIITDLVCKCGNRINLPINQRKVHCMKCKGKWYRPYNKKWEFSMPEFINCDCGNKVVISYEAVEKKCFQCNHYWIISEQNVWEKQQFTIKQDTLTIGDIEFKTRKRK